MSSFSGNVLFLNRSDINTDEIIPAKYLTEISKDALKPFLLEDLNMEGFNPRNDLADKQVIVTRSNFGCGSSREHAPWALEVNGIRLVIAHSYARIFRQNMFNCGMMAVELPAIDIERLFSEFAGGPAVIETDLSEGFLRVRSQNQTAIIPFAISEFDRALVEAGGWLEFADQNY